MRVRAQPLQEALAVMGIAAGVALLFAVQVASTSITGSQSRLAKAVTGSASLEVAARSPAGMNQSVFDRVASAPGVRAAAPIIEQRISVAAHDGRDSLVLVGIDDRLASVGGELVRRFRAKRGDLNDLGLFLTSKAAQTVGAKPGETVYVDAGGKRKAVPLTGTLGTRDLGNLAHSSVAVAPLGLAQRLAGMPNRIDRVLVEPERGARARSNLASAFGGQLNVRGSDADVAMLAEALKPDKQSSALFSAIAVAIGMLFAYNAMLLALVKRRRIVAYLRMLGADRPTMVATFVFEAILLGVAASILGLVAGILLSKYAFNAVPAYLTAGFSVGSQHVVATQTVFVSAAGGLVAALLASAIPLIELYRTAPGEAMHEHFERRSVGSMLLSATALWCGVALLGVTSAVVFAFPQAAPVGIAGLIVGLALVVGPLVNSVLLKLARIFRIRGGIAISTAVGELAANPMRSAVLAVISACAVAALVSIGGARLDLQRGMRKLDVESYRTADFWVAPPQPVADFTQPFDAGSALARLKHDPALASVDRFRGAFLDIGNRRVRVVAPPPTQANPVAPSQVMGENAAVVTQRIRAGGWVAVSRDLARDLGAREVGHRIALPTPTGERNYRVAAMTFNYGWPPGVIVMNARDFAEAWGSNSVSALMIHTAPGAKLAAVSRGISMALGAANGLQTRASNQLVAERTEITVQGMARVRQISSLVLGASILAIVAAMFTAVWQRRSQLAAMRAIGMYRSEVHRALMAETSLIVFLGGLTGLAVGLYSQVLTSHWTEITTGYRSPFQPALGFGILKLAEAVLLAAAVTILPALLITRIAPRAEQAE